MEKDFTQTSEVAILLDTTNKYTPGRKKFRLQSVSGLQENSTTKESENLNLSNILNADISALPISQLKKSDIIELELPREVTRNYPTKFIPAGTRFIVNFTSGDITKPVIVGREF